MTDYSLKFDGYKLSLLGDGALIKSWDAVSGVAGFQSPDNQSLKSTGPIPEGNWSFNTSAIQTITLQGHAIGTLSSLLYNMTGLSDLKRGTWYGGEVAWGLERAFLTPSDQTDTLGRDNFSIHGGDFYGSAGCIDLGHNEVDFFRTLTSKWHLGYFTQRTIRSEPSDKSTAACRKTGACRFFLYPSRPPW